MVDSRIYTRTSVDEAKNPRASNQTQEETCRKKAEENIDKITRVYSDIGKSGTSMESRKEFQQMIKDAEDGLFNRLYLLNQSRFARDLVDQELAIKHLLSLGISIFFCDDGLVEEKTTFIRQVKGAYNEEQIRIMKEQTRIEHNIRLEKRLPVSRPPMGYKQNRKTKRWDVDPKKAEFVKNVFRMASSGVRMKEISKETKLSIPTLTHMLKNRVYLGIYTYKERELIDNHEAIIDKEVFEKCQMSEPLQH